MNFNLIAYLLFLSGFLYYSILPIVAVILFSDNKITTIALRGMDFDDISLYMRMAFFVFLFFSMGYYLSSHGKILRFKYRRVKKVWQFTGLIIVFYFIFILLTVNVGEIVSLVGYLEGYDVIHRGQLTTIYLTSIWWAIYFRSGLKMKLMLISALISGVNLLALGSRLGVVSGLISLAIFFSFERQKISGGMNILKVVKIGGLVFVAGLFFSIVGLLRQGDAIIWEAIVDMFFAEPLFIYASFPSYVSKNQLPLIAIPWDVITGVVGSIPTALFPGKLDFFSKYVSMDSDFASGFGGINHILSVIINFGLIGFPIIAFLEGAWFGFLAKNAHKNNFLRALAICSISLLPFIFFRDGYQTSVKLLFFNYLFFPYIIVKICSKTHKYPEGVEENVTRLNECKGISV